MNRSHLVALIVGIGIGVGITLMFQVSRPAAPSTTPVSTIASSVKPAASEPTTTATELPAEPATLPPPPPPPPAKIETAPPPPPKAESAAPPPTAQPPFDFEAAFAEVAKKGLAAYASKEMRELANTLKASGTNGVLLVTDQLQNSTSPQERFLAAALLEKIGNPAALPALEAVLKSDPDLLVRRMASHAAALIGTDAAVAVLRPAMLNDEDWGVRVNSAYGLAKLKQQDGLDTLQQYYVSPQTPPEYSLPILGGLADVADPSTGPLFRKVLADTTDPGYVLIAIGALEKMKDTQALPDLQRISTSAQSDMIRQAAQRAIDNINK